MNKNKRRKIIAIALVATLACSGSITGVFAAENEMFETINTNTASIENQLNNQQDTQSGYAVSDTESDMNTLTEQLVENEKNRTVSAENAPTEQEEKKEARVAEKQTAKASVLDDWNYEDYNGGYVLKEYKGTATDIVIPGEIDGKQVYVNGGANPVTSFSSDVTSITLQEKNGEKVKVENASNLFAEYEHLQRVDVSGLDTSNSLDMSGMFENCRTLSDIIGLDTLDTSSVKYMNYTFKDCRELKSLQGLQTWKTPKLSLTVGMFSNCTSLEDISALSSWSTPNLQSITYMFSNCTSLENISALMNLDTSSVYGMRGTFKMCSNLTDVTPIKDWNVSRVTDFAELFQDCINLKVVNLSGWKFWNNAITDSMFLTTNEIPLLVIAQDEKLKQYDYEADNRTSLINIFDTNGGEFNNGTTEHRVGHNYVIEDINDDTINNMIEEAKNIVKIISDDPTRTGYTFAGWEENALQPTGKPLLDVYNKLTNTFTAKWTANDYTIQFDKNTGEGNMADLAMKYDTPANLPAYTFTKEGYTFKGWSTTADGQVVYEDGASVNNLATKPNETVTLYAVWEINQYTVTFKDWDGSVLKTEQVAYNTGATAPTEPNRDGYRFAGWDAAFDNITGDTVVTATYAVNQYTVTFKDWDGTVLKTEQVAYNTGATAPTDPTRDGYRFTGWDKTFDTITENAEITAQYVKTWTVTFQDEDGTVLKTETVDEGTGATAPTEPTKEGHTFTGWDVAFDNITGDTVVTAQYEKEEAIVPPTEPEQPQTPGQSGEMNNTETEEKTQTSTNLEAAKTGDNSIVEPLLATGGISSVAAAIAFFFRKKKKSEQ